ncbi:MAG: hypothetical protein JST54_24280 [Deltaproteobacteria bacterium]|nr:hypothetical protein [Deltaproteobacteria bacterium]
MLMLRNLGDWLMALSWGWSPSLPEAIAVLAAAGSFAMVLQSRAQIGGSSAGATAPALLIVTLSLAFTAASATCDLSVGLFPIGCQLGVPRDALAIEVLREARVTNVFAVALALPTLLLSLVGMRQPSSPNVLARTRALRRANRWMAASTAMAAAWALAVVFGPSAGR